MSIVTMHKLNKDERYDRLQQVFHSAFNTCLGVIVYIIISLNLDKSSSTMVIEISVMYQYYAHNLYLIGMLQDSN